MLQTLINRSRRLSYSPEGNFRTPPFLQFLLAYGAMLMMFAAIGPDTPIWLIVVQALVLGFFTSMQYTSMNTLVYADVSSPQMGGASTIAATGQQLAISFGVAGAALIAALFVPAGMHSHPATIIHGTQQAFLALGILTVLSSVTFMELKADDGEGMSRHDAAHHRPGEH